jgi:hypothetical protein
MYLTTELIEPPGPLTINQRRTDNPMDKSKRTKEETVKYPASFTARTGRHDIAEILLKVAFSTINQINSIYDF